MSANGNALIVFLSSGQRGRFEIGTPVLECARRLGLDLDSVCGGERAIGISQPHVRAIRFAKSPLCAGARLPMDLTGIDWVYRISLAGAFRSHVGAKYGMLPGRIPDCRPDRVSSARSPAGRGAHKALLNRAAGFEVEALARRIGRVERAIEPGFHEHFWKAMPMLHMKWRTSRTCRGQCGGRKPSTRAQGIRGQDDPRGERSARCECGEFRA